MRENLPLRDVLLLAACLLLPAAWSQPSTIGEHPRARHYVEELASSDDPRLQYWGWQHLEYMAEGALPSLQPLLEHSDPIRQWKALALVRPYRMQDPERVPVTLREPEWLTFPAERSSEAIFLVAEEASQSVVIHAGALSRVHEGPAFRTSPWHPWKDLMRWLEDQSSIEAESIGGVLVLARASEESEPRRMAAGEAPPEVPPLEVHSRVMRNVEPSAGMRVIDRAPAGAGLVVMPGAWARQNRFDYLLQGARWDAAVAAMARYSDLELSWHGTVLVVAAPEDEVPAFDPGELLLPAPLAIDRDQDAPRLGRYARLSDDPLKLLGELASRAGCFLTVLESAEERIEEMPHIVRRGDRNQQASPWIHARFSDLPPLETLCVVARICGLEASVDQQQVTLRARPDR